jgi:nucleotide-binding universal stress UspA family protein
MDTIIVATDFSSPAENAMLYAGSIAAKLKSPIILLHVYQVPVSMAEVPVMMISIDELKAGGEEGLSKAKQVLQNVYPSINISVENRMGDVKDELQELCKTVSPLAIVIGRHMSTGLERFLFGNTLISVVRHSRFPVIVVPDTFTNREIRNVALAVDEPEDELPEAMIRSFVGALDAALHIIHVQIPDTEQKEYSALASQLNARYTVVYNDQFFNGVESYLKENQIDLLITLPHKHSIVERLVFKTHTEELLKKLSIPIVCMRAVE